MWKTLLVIKMNSAPKSPYMGVYCGTRIYTHLDHLGTEFWSLDKNKDLYRTIPKKLKTEKETAQLNMGVNLFRGEHMGNKHGYTHIPRPYDYILIKNMYKDNHLNNFFI
jgi:hypothetical protein